MLEALLEGTVAVLLAATIGWCFVVHRRLRRFAAERGTLEEAIGRLDAASARAEEAARALRRALAEAGDDLERQRTLARREAEELRRLPRGPIAAPIRPRAHPSQAATARPATAPGAPPAAPRPAAEAAPPAPERLPREQVLQALEVLR